MSLCVREPKQVEFVGHQETIMTDSEEERYWVNFNYLVEVDPKEVTIGEPEMCDGIEWYLLDDLPQPQHPSVKGNVKMIQEYLAKNQN